MKRIDKKTKQFIADKFAKKWVEENKDMLKDYQELCHNLLMFRALWGIEIGIVFNNPKEVQGRELGVDFEEHFDAQEFTNKNKEYASKPFKKK